ncbi:MAG: sigma-70 family RNA polymerase sigma factor [Gemmatimonadetes bacterium]|nr:sigma-70 family RNA polymerase sigma factor [Gemmatimonadota bacterium]MCC6769790.1 sigma-70 family RNA polymerase sigma factor [Gemmatimonadaceae bacterium]
MSDDDARPFDALVARLYAELRSLAHSHLQRERDGHTLSTTALVHEAWLRLAGTEERLPVHDPAHFVAIASTTMRRVLVDCARRRHRAKRGGDVAFVSFDEGQDFLELDEAEELVALDEALDRLALVNPRAAEVVTHRFFGGRSLEETAAILHVSLKTVQRDWIAARAWLRKEVEHDLGVLGPVD